MSSTDMSILASTEELYELNTCSAIGTLLLSCQNPSLCLASVAMSMGGGRKEQLGGDYGFLTPCPTHGTGQISSESQAAGRNPPGDCPFIPCIISTQYLAHILGSRVCQFSAPSWGAFPLWDVAQTRGRTPFCSLAFRSRLVFNRICMCRFFFFFFWKRGGPQMIYSSYLKDIFLELLPAKRLSSKKSRMKLLKEHCRPPCPVGKFTFPNTDVVLGI